MDITAAFVQQFIKTGRFADKMFHFIAAGALSLDKAMQGGLGVMCLGVFFHYFIAFAFTLFFFLAYPRWDFLSKHRYGSSVLHGLFVWTVMNLVVLPLSRLPHEPFDFKSKAIGACILVLAIGLPVSIGAGNYYRKANAGVPDILRP